MVGNSDLTRIAKALGKTEAQVAIRWSFQKKYITIPKSSNAERIRENVDLDWEIPADHMEACAALDTGFKASGACEAMNLSWEEVQ
jgi:diketogulonate reductase-like aldo/keto reductase